MQRWRSIESYCCGHRRWRKKPIRPVLSIMLEVMAVHVTCLNRSVQSWAQGIMGMHSTHGHTLHVSFRFGRFCDITSSFSVAWNLMPVPVILIQSISADISNYRDEKRKRDTLGWWKWVERGEKSEYDRKCPRSEETGRRIQTAAAKRNWRYSTIGAPSSKSFNMLNLNWKLTWSRCPKGPQKASAAWVADASVWLAGEWGDTCVCVWHFVLVFCFSNFADATLVFSVSTDCAEKETEHIGAL